MLTHPQMTALFRQLEKQNPHPETELQYSSPFELLIAVILSAQSTDKGVNKATALLFPAANTPEAILALGESGLKSYVRTIGLYPTKVKHILRTCEILIQHHHSQVPSTREALESLPGVGRKTANVLLNVLFDQATIPVDTHIFRVANRTGLAHGNSVLKVEKQLVERVPLPFQKQAHHWLVLHGRYICKARSPQCDTCSISAYCEYYRQRIVPNSPPQ